LRPLSPWRTSFAGFSFPCPLPFQPAFQKIRGRVFGFQKAKYSALPLDSVFLDLLTGGWVDELAFLAAWLPSLSRVVLKKSDSENVRSSSPDSADLADFWPFCLDEFGVVAKRFLPFLAADSRLKSAREGVCSSPSLILSSSPDSDNSSSDGPGIAELLSSKPR